MQVIMRIKTLKLVVLAIVCYALWYGTIQVLNHSGDILWYLTTPIVNVMGGDAQ